MNNLPDQPELRAFVSYDRLPANCIAFPITNEDSIPHLRPGDVAVVDPSQRDPVERELFVIEYGRTHRPSRHVVELWTHVQHCLARGEFVGWWSGAYARRQLNRRAAAVASHFDMIDGPLVGEEGIAYLKEMLIGRVIGVLEACYEEPRRLALPSS